jgi:polysaccharide pyruvyl transferase WcaK-like protein
LSEGHLDALHALARGLFDTCAELRILLIPHVLKPIGHPESDWAACLDLERHLRVSEPHRVAALPPHYDASELKHVLSRLDWFCGARMHACIGAFSSGVPTLPLAYSDKANGVFAACGFPKAVADLRRLDSSELACAARESFERRERQAIEQARRLPELWRRGESQMDAIAQTVVRLGRRERAA